MIRLRFVFSSIYKRIETNLQREEAVAGEFELGSVVEECEWYGTWDMRERTRGGKFSV